MADATIGKGGGGAGFDTIMAPKPYTNHPSSPPYPELPV